MATLGTGRQARRPKGRASERARLEGAASRVEVPPACDVCVVGGGAAGLVAGIVAAEADARVVVLDRGAECGRTILATGGGRCNLANRDLAASRYLHPGFVAQAMGADPLARVLAFFEESGLFLTEEEGRIYPKSLSAASVRDVLVARALRAGATLAPLRETRRVRRVADARATDGSAGRLEVAFDELWAGGDWRSLRAGCVVLATGGTSSTARVGAAGRGTAQGAASHRLELERLDVPRVPLEPVLCPLASDLAELACLDGRRVRCVATLERDGKPLMSEAGEALFRAHGLSGIVSFDLSRKAKAGDVVALDLVPGVAEGDVAASIRRLGARVALDGMLDPEISVVLASMRQGAAPTARLAKRFEVPVTGLAETERAQVMRGGISVDALSPETLEACGEPGLFACGEAVDVDGPCGGYNLAWAWTSGMAAGSAAAREAKSKADAGEEGLGGRP